MRDFEGKVAVVTGAASGLGRAFAERFAQEGMKVVLADVEEPALEVAVQELRRREHDVLGVLTDVSKAESVEQLARETLATYGKVHILCNNAGVSGGAAGPGGIIWEATLKDWQWLVGVNFWGVVHGIRTFLPIMLRQDEEGHVVNTASTAGLTFGNSVYSATKHAVVAISEALYVQLKQRGAKVSASVLCPGLTATRIIYADRNRPQELANEVEPPPEAMGLDTTAAFRERASRTAKPPEQVADVVLEAIRDDRFYVFADEALDQRVRPRMEAILGQANPPVEPRR